MKNCGVTFLFILLLFCMSCTQAGRVEFTLVNKSNEEIAKATIELSDQKFIVEGLKPEESKMFYAKAIHDSHYTIHIEFISGKTLTKEVGYVTRGVEFKDLLLVKDDDVILETNRKVIR
jgi:hypothetical protein